MTRATVFVVALVPRLLVAWFTFGSVDAIHCVRNFVRMLEGQWIITPYLPGVELLLWVAGMASYFTSLPVLFPFKVVPAVCDALIALLLFDAAPDRRSALRAGLVYAVMPVPVFIAGVHPQWESMFLYPLLLALVLLERQTTRAVAMAGMAFVISVIVKPVAAPLVIFLIPRTRRAIAFAGGAAAAVVAYAAALAATGFFPDLTRLRGIVQYASGGVQVFGLAVRPQDRLIPIVAALAIASFVYFRRKCTRAEAVLLFFAITLGLSGLSVQYLCWVLPLAVLCRRMIFLALYNIAAGVFVYFYYVTPAINLPHIEDLGGFGLLRPFGWLEPPLPPIWMRTVLQIDGNLVIPLLLLGFAAIEVVRMLRLPPAGVVHASGPASGGGRPGGLHYTAPAIAIAVLFAFATIWAAAQKPMDPAAYIVRIEQRVEEYDVIRYRGTGVRPGTKVWLARSLREPGVSHPIVNATNIALLWIAVSALAAGLSSLRVSSAAHERREAA